MKPNKLATEFAWQICRDFKIIEAINYLKNESIEALQDTYGDYEDGFGMEEYSIFQIYAHEKFDSWFNKNLDDAKKTKLLEIADNSERFEIKISSHRRSNLIMNLLFKLRRTNTDRNTHLNVFIDFPSIESHEYEIYAEMFGQLTDDEISKMHMMYELKR